MEDQPLSAQQQPALDVGIEGRDDGSVHISFSVGIERLAFQPEEALGFAAAIINTVAALVKEGKAKGNTMGIIQQG
jgi:hypothetical protein